jgi:hypothetical protein
LGSSLQPGVVRQADVAERLAAPGGPGETQQPERRRGHHHALSGADGQARAQQRLLGAPGQRRQHARAHERGAREHHRRRGEPVGQPAAARPRDDGGQRGGADEQPERHGVVHERRQDAQDGAQSGVAEQGGTEHGEVGGSRHALSIGAKRFVGRRSVPALASSP